MEHAVNLLVILEILFINLWVVDYYCDRRYSRLFTYFITFIFSAAVFFISFYLVCSLPGYGHGSGAFIVMGFIFLPIFMLLYKNYIGDIISIVSSSLIYTSFIFFVAVNLARGIAPPDIFAEAVLLIQTLLYAATGRLFIRWIKKFVVFILKNTAKKVSNYVRIISISWSITIMTANIAFTYQSLSFLKSVCFVMLMADIFMSYYLVYKLMKSHDNLNHLRKIAYIDHLTKLRNRLSMFDDANLLISAGTPFTLIFFDLNRLKSINDQYGHLAGDDYLRFFAKHVYSLLSDDGELYRMSGDEFICIYTGNSRDEFISRLHSFPAFVPDLKIPFYGYSIGVSEFPTDSTSLDKLLLYADRKMYEEKQNASEVLSE